MAEIDLENHPANLPLWILPERFKEHNCVDPFDPCPMCKAIAKWEACWQHYNGYIKNIQVSHKDGRMDNEEIGCAVRLLLEAQRESQKLFDETPELKEAFTKHT